MTAAARIDAVVVGAGQAGLALSRHLTGLGCEHVLLERGRVGERWHSARWDDLSLLTPNAFNRLPGQRLHPEPGAFMSRGAFARVLDAYAFTFSAPVLERTPVELVEQAGERFAVRAGGSTWSARSVVVATGDCDRPRVPRVARELPAGIVQLHSSEFRRAQLLEPGAVLVVGAGASGQQIARDLRRAGRDVVLAVGRHARAPRRYRGRDIWEWLAATGALHATIDEQPEPEAARRAPSFPLTGTGGGSDIDLAVLAAEGVRMAGRLLAVDGHVARFGDNLQADAADADRRLARLLATIDEHIALHRLELDAPLPPAPVELPAPPAALDLREAGIATVIWATGYRRDHRWVGVEGALTAAGEVEQRHGVSPVPGLFTLGMRFQHRRMSHFIGGVGTDAAEIAAAVAARAARGGAGRQRRPQPAGAGLA